MAALAIAVALAVMGRSATAEDAACRSGEPDGETSSLLQAQVRAPAAAHTVPPQGGGSCNTVNCGCPPYTDSSCSFYNMGPWCSQSEAFCSTCSGTWCGSGDGPTPSPAPGGGGSCNTVNCGCPPYTDPSCSFYNMGPWCSASEAFCSTCSGTWCPGSADNSSEPTPATPIPAPAVGGSSGGGSCKTRNCGCGPYTDMGPQMNCANYDMGPHCSQSEAQCSGCHGTWCPASSLLQAHKVRAPAAVASSGRRRTTPADDSGSADDSGDPTPTPAPPVGGSVGGSCKTRNCGCGPYTDMGPQMNCANYDMGPHCSQSETQCSGCHGTWCPGSADDSSGPTPATPTPAPAVGGSSGGGSCKTRNCGCGPYTDMGPQMNCANYDMGPHCSQSETQCSGCHGTWCPASSLLQAPGSK